jgi:F-type H+-transporting ATPase subunit a
MPGILDVACNPMFFCTVVQIDKTYEGQAQHVMLKVFATFVVMMAGAGTIGVIGAAGPLALNVILIGFEFLVAFLQAYVFAILTSIYLHDAVHLH